MRIVNLSDETRKINGVVAKLDTCSTITFTRYGVNENGVYDSEIIKEEVDFEDPADDFENIDKSPKVIDTLRRKKLREIAEEHFPEIKTLYVEFF